MVYAVYQHHIYLLAVQETQVGPPSFSKLKTMREASRSFSLWLSNCKILLQLGRGDRGGGGRLDNCMFESRRDSKSEWHKSLNDRCSTTSVINWSILSERSCIYIHTVHSKYILVQHLRLGLLTAVVAPDICNNIFSA